MVAPIRTKAVRVVVGNIIMLMETDKCFISIVARRWWFYIVGWRYS